MEPIMMQEGKTTNVGGVRPSVLLFQRLLTGVVSACVELDQVRSSWDPQGREQDKAGRLGKAAEKGHGPATG